MVSMGQPVTAGRKGKFQTSCFVSRNRYSHARGIVSDRPGTSPSGYRVIPDPEVYAGSIARAGAGRHTRYSPFVV